MRPRLFPPRYKEGTLLTKYIAVTFTYLAAMIGIADKAIGLRGLNLSQVSKLQWGAIVVATLSYAVVVVETRRTGKELAKQKQQRTKVQNLASIQVRVAIDVLLRPYRLFLRGIITVDDWARLDDSRYVLQQLSDPGVRSHFNSVDARANANVYPVCKNWELIAENTTVARNLLGESVSKFSSYLNAEIIEAVEALRADEMVGMRLPNLAVLITANQDMTTFTLQHVFEGMGDYAAFNTMLLLIGTLLDRIESVAKAA
jgi:hypothetical protein